MSLILHVTIYEFNTVIVIGKRSRLQTTVVESVNDRNWQNVTF